MKRDRWWARRIFAGGATGMAALTGACLSIDWPPTVESGHGGGGASAATAEAGIIDAGEDTSFDANGITGFICSVQAQTGFEAECITYSNVPSTTELLGYMHDCLGPGPVGTVLPQGSTCPDLSAVTGCCQLTGRLDQECYYAMDSTPDSTQASCQAHGGIWSTTPNPYQ